MTSTTAADGCKKQSGSAGTALPPPARSLNFSLCCSCYYYIVQQHNVQGLGDRE